METKYLPFDIRLWQSAVGPSDRTTLRGFLDQMEKTYGKAKRMWGMDRGIPTEEILQETRDPAREIFYLVGTPKGKIQQCEKKWLDLPCAGGAVGRMLMGGVGRPRLLAGLKRLLFLVFYYRPVSQLELSASRRVAPSSLKSRAHGEI